MSAHTGTHQTSTLNPTPNMTPTRATILLSKHWQTIALFAVLGLILGVVLSFVRPLEYRSSTRLLITQDAIITDSYTAARSAERVADDLASIISTTTFFEQMLASDFGIDASQFLPGEENAAKRRKRWHRMVDTSVARGTGLLTINVFNKDPEQSRQISQAISFVLTQQGWRYTSGGDINVRQVDEPLVSKYPVRPNLPANGFMGLIIGILSGGVFVFVRAEQVRNRHKFMHGAR